MKFAGALAFVCFAGLAGAGCGGGGGNGGSNPIPAISSLSPSHAMVGSTPVTVTVTGSGFINTSVVRWNASPRTTTFQSATQLVATFTAADLGTASVATVSVESPTPGGGTSGALDFTVENPLPTLTSINPSSIAAGSPDTVLTLHGTGFVATSTVLWNGTPLVTTSSTATQLMVTLPAASLLTLGDLPVVASNPNPGGGTSTGLPLHVAGPLRVSVATTGPDVDGSSLDSDISIDGRYLAFASRASNLVSGDTKGQFDVFLRDTCLGAAAGCVPATHRVSVASDGTEGDGDSGNTSANPELGVSISGNGRYVAFVSAASNLVPGDTNGVDDVFVRDTCLGAAAGCTPTTRLASVGVGGVPATAGSAHPGVSRSGRFVAFASFAPNLVASDGNLALDIFIRDTCAGAPAGCVPSTSRASINNSGIEGNADSIHPAFSGDERYLAFASNATNLVSGDTNGVGDIFLRDTCFGASGGCVPSTVRVSLADTGGESNSRAAYPKVSMHGRHVAFMTESSNLVTGDTNGVADLYIRDTCLGAPPGCTPTTIRASLTNAGAQAGVDGSVKSSLSDDGRYAAFESSGSAYVPTDPSPTFNVLVRDTCNGAPAGCMPSTTRLSASFDGVPGDNLSFDPALSADGRFMAFTSYSSNLVPGATPPGTGNIYVAPTY